MHRVSCKQVLPENVEGAVRAEALRWENRRLAQAKADLEDLTREQHRRILQASLLCCNGAHLCLIFAQ